MNKLIKNINPKRYLIYLLRWQLSTPVMVPVTLLLGATLLGAVAANLGGGLVFFWIDKIIFSSDRSDLVKKYILYLGRWQITSITLYPALLIFGSGWRGVIMGNLIGGLIFYFVDSWIFKERHIPIYWEVLEKNICYDCGKIGRGYRIIKTKNYDRTKDKNPQFRCESCSERKTKELRERGLSV